MSAHSRSAQLLLLPGASLIQTSSVWTHNYSRELLNMRHTNAVVMHSKYSLLRLSGVLFNALALGSSPE